MLPKEEIGLKLVNKFPLILRRLDIVNVGGGPRQLHPQQPW